MATAKKTQATQDKGNQDAQLIVNNAFIDGLANQLKQKEQIGLTFPPDYNVTNALTGAYLALKEPGKDGKSILQKCSQSSIANSIMDMATYGLSVQKKQGYFIAYGTRCEFQKSYFGNTAISRRYGMKKINASVIYDGDTFKYHKEDGMTVIDEHTQDFQNIDNNRIIGAYAVAIMSDGEKIAEVMNISQIKQAWKQGYGYKEKGDGAHQKFADQMAEKTVKNRLLKFINNTYGDSMIAYMDEKEDMKEPEDIILADQQVEIEDKANKEKMPIDNSVFDEPEDNAPEKVSDEDVEVEEPDNVFDFDETESEDDVK